MLVDLDEVRFLSSAGLRVLLRAAKVAKATNRAFALCALRPAVLEVFEISGFDRVLRTFATRDDALAALG